MQIPVQFKNNKHQILNGIIHKPKKYDTAIIFLHGFPGSMFGTAQRLLTLFSKFNFLCFRFEFAGTNTSEGKFEEKLMSQEIKDTKYAIDFLQKNYPTKRIILIGHSTGATIASLYAHKDKRIGKLILLGAVSDLKHAVHYDFTDQQIHNFWKKGYITYNRPDSWVHHKRLKRSYYNEFFTLNIPKAIKKYHHPLLIIHGTEDHAIPLKEAKELHNIANKPKKLILIKGADHRFSRKYHQLKVVWHIYRFIKHSSSLLL